MQNEKNTNIYNYRCSHLYAHILFKLMQATGQTWHLILRSKCFTSACPSIQNTYDIILKNYKSCSNEISFIYLRKLF